MAFSKELTTQAGALCVGAVALASPVAAASIAPVALPLITIAAIGLHLKDGCAKKACGKAQKAIIKALKGQPEFSPQTLTRAISLLKDAASPLSLSTEILLTAAKSGNFEAEVVQHLQAPLTLDAGESATRRIRETALLAGLTACRQDKSFHQSLTQELLIEAAHVNNVQLDLLSEIKAQNEKTHAELEGLRAQVGSLSKALDHISRLTKDQLEALATRFEIPRPYDLSIEQLREALNARAEDYRTYRADIEAIDERTKGLGNLKAAAQEAADRLDFEAVENLLAMVDATETEIAAQGKELRARNALLRGKVEQAFTILSAAADSFGSLDPLASSEKRNMYCSIIYHHAVRYGGPALLYAIQMFQEVLNSLTREDAPDLWAELNNNLANAFAIRGTGTHGSEGADLLNKAISAYQNTLTVFTKDHAPVSWATTLMNLANTLCSLAERGMSDEGYALVNRALNLYFDALSILTQKENATQWATIKNNVGAALRKISRYPQVYSEKLALEQSINSFREALTVRSVEAFSEDRALTLNNLGNALCDQARYVDGSAGVEIIRQAIAEYQESLTIRTKDQHPLAWAMTTTNLANAFKDMALRSHRKSREMYLKKAASRYLNARFIFTNNDHSVQRARTNVNLAIVEASLAQNTDGSDLQAHLRAALAYVKEALTVFDPIHMPPDHAKASELREEILKALKYQ